MRLLLPIFQHRAMHYYCTLRLISLFLTFPGHGKAQLSSSSKDRFFWRVVTWRVQIYGEEVFNYGPFAMRRRQIEKVHLESNLRTHIREKSFIFQRSWSSLPRAYGADRQVGFAYLAQVYIGTPIISRNFSQIRVRGGDPTSTGAFRNPKLKLWEQLC